MNIRNLSIFAVFIGLLLSLTSCVKDSDFSATETKLPTQSIDSDLVISTLDANDFIDTSERKEVIVRTDTMFLEGMNSELFLGQLTQTQLSFKFINTLDRDFKVDFEFLNAEHKVIHNVHVPISAGTIDTPRAVEATVIIKEPELINFKEASKLIYKITLPPTEKPLNTDTDGKISLLSKATHLYDI